MKQIRKKNRKLIGSKPEIKSRPLHREVTPKS